MSKQWRSYSACWSERIDARGAFAEGAKCISGAIRLIRRYRPTVAIDRIPVCRQRTSRSVRFILHAAIVRAQLRTANRR